MLTLRNLMKRVYSMDINSELEAKALRDKLTAEHGQAGIDKLVDIIEDEKAPEQKRIACLVVLGIQLTTVKTGTEQGMRALEAAARSSAPTLAEIALHGCYANGVLGRQEAVEVVEAFRLGDPEHKAVFNRVDMAYKQSTYIQQVAMSLAGTGTVH